MKALAALGPLAVEALVEAIVKENHPVLLRHKEQALGMLPCKKLVAAVLADRIARAKDAKLRKKLETAYVLAVDQALRKARAEEAEAAKAIRIFSDATGSESADRIARASVSLRSSYEAIVTACIAVLRRNAGKKPSEMQPNHVAVKESIRQLARLSGFCEEVGKSGKATKAIIAFIGEDFLLRATKPSKGPLGDVPLGPPGGMQILGSWKTEASRALVAFGKHGAAEIVNYISEGKAGKSFVTRNQARSAPRLLNDTLERIFGSSILAGQFLKQQLGEKTDPTEPLARFYDYHKSLYSAPHPQDAKEKKKGT